MAVRAAVRAAVERRALRNMAVFLGAVSGDSAPMLGCANRNKNRLQGNGSFRISSESSESVLSSSVGRAPLQVRHQQLRRGRQRLPPLKQIAKRRRAHASVSGINRSRRPR
jgi:hypothetical protein